MALKDSVIRNVLPSPRARITNAIHQEIALNKVPMMATMINDVIIANSEE